MTVAREFEAVYVWGAQTGGARRFGVPEETIVAIRDNHSRGIAPEDAEIVELTRQLLRRHRADEASFKRMQTRFGSDGLIQLTGAIGYYSLLAMTVNACELEAAQRRGAEDLSGERWQAAAPAAIQAPCAVVGLVLLVAFVALCGGYAAFWWYVAGRIESDTVA